MRPLGRGIERLLSGLGISREVAGISALDGWPAAAGAVFGAHAAETRAIHVDGDVLVVAVPDAAWSGEIRLREPDLLAALRREAPRAGVRRIRTVPAKRPSAP